MKVTCDQGCQKEFTIQKIKTEKSQTLPNNLERYYFTCPGCDQEYTSYFLDDDMKQMQSEIMLLKSKTDLKIKQKNRLLKLTRKLAAMNQQYMKAYQETVGNHG